jgi:hypothetical protein
MWARMIIEGRIRMLYMVLVITLPTLVTAQLFFNFPAGSSQVRYRE